MTSFSPFRLYPAHGTLFGLISGEIVVIEELINYQFKFEKLYVLELPGKGPEAEYIHDNLEILT